jgi:hypothetical protein
MHVLRAVIVLVLAAATFMPPVSAAPRDFKLCSAAVATCECPRQARSCAPLCHLEPPVVCPTT